MKPLGVGVVGCGYIANAAHLPYLSKMPEVSVVAVADTDATKREETRARFGVPRAYATTRDLLADAGVDAVFVCLPTSLHAEVALAAIAAGKHVFCEKPMARDSAECQAMLDAAERAGVRLMVGHYLRFLPNHQQAVRLLREGKIGEPLLLEAHAEMPLPDAPAGHFYFQEKEGGGVLFDYGSHLIDLLLWLAAPARPVTVQGQTARLGPHEVETVASASIAFDNGVVGRVTAVWHPWTGWEAQERYVKVVGTKGKLQSELTGPSLKAYRANSLLARTVGVQTLVPRGLHARLPASSQAYKNQVVAFVKYVRDGVPPPGDARAAMDVVRIIEAVRRSSATGEAVRVAR